jgi:hypothetical protein
VAAVRGGAAQTTVRFIIYRDKRGGGDCDSNTRDTNCYYYYYYYYYYECREEMRNIRFINKKMVSEDAIPYRRNAMVTTNVATANK